MSFDWPLKPLQLVASEVTVGYVGPMASEYVESGVPFLRSLNIEPFGVNTNDLKFITPDFHKRIKKSILRPGDVAIVRTGKPGTCSVIPDWLEEANCSDLVIVRCGEEIRPHFLCYWVNSIASHHISSHTVGAVQQHFNVGAAKTMNVAVPSLKDQDKVLEVLRGLDDRITLLRETNATLEAIAQALFKSWFVDFDPVRAKMAGRAPEGMDEATAALFPDALEESELGLVPKGWSVKTLADVTAYLNRGISPKYVDDGGLLVLNQKCVRNFSIDWSKGRRHDPNQRKVDGRLLEKGDVLVNSTGVGTLGRVGQILSLPEPAIVDSHVTVVRAGEAVTWSYLGQWMQSRQEQIEAMGEGSTGQTELSRSKLGSMPLLVPARAALAAFDTAVLPLKARISCNADTAQSLSSLRDVLLPRLISGQLRLPEAQSTLEEVA
jgi:type I restriction enzyme S subunit